MESVFQALRNRWLAADERESEFRSQLKARYSNIWEAPRSKQTRLQALMCLENDAAEAIFAWLDAHSPRAWRSGVPSDWVCRERIAF